MISTLFNISDLLAVYGYVGVFVVIFLESGIFFALPGDSLLFTAGLLASVSHLNLALLIPLIFLATFLGGIAGYYIGHYIEHLHEYAFFRNILKQSYIDQAHSFFERHGKAAIILSRFVPVVRTFAPIVAGIAEMPFGRFLRYSFISSLLWSLTVTLLGFFLGREFPWVRDYISYFIIGIILVSCLPAVLGWAHKRRKRKKTK